MGSKRALQSLGLLGVGLLLLALVLRQVGVDAVLAELRTADRRLLGYAALVFFTQFVTMGLRWWVAMRLLGHQTRLIPILRANGGSNFINFFAPGHFGEPVMSWWLARSSAAPGVEAFTVLVACKVVATLLSFAVLIACLPFLATGAETPWLTQVGVTAAAIGVATAVALAILLRPAIADWGARLARRVVAATVGRVRPAASERAADAAAAMILRVRDTLALFATRPAALVATAGISAVKIAGQIVFVMLLYAAFAQPVTVAGSTFLVTVDVLQNILSIWIPANMGVQEALLTAAASGGLAIDPAVAASATIAHKAILIVHVTLGGLLFLALGLVDRRR